MSNYFSYFPKTTHDLTNNGESVSLTNIMRRFKIKSAIKSNTQVFHNYDIQEGDRPDIIAHKYYGSSNYAWVVLHYNDIVDPVFGWPLFSKDLDRYIVSKYGSIEIALSTIHEYRKILTKAKMNLNGDKTNERYVVVDKATYDMTVPAERKTLYKYDYEQELQEKKSKIKLLDKRYLPKLRDEVENILRVGI
jgi:hypothetical protein